MKRVQIVGGGFSGLTLAWYLAKSGAAVEIYEKSSRVGGLLGTRQTPHGISETAANALILTPAVENLFRELNLPLVTALKSSSRRFFWRGKLSQWPLRLHESIFFAFRLFSSFVMKRKNLPPRTAETVEAWGQRNLGSAPTNYLLAPALQGIYAGDLKKLSASLILGPMFQKRKKYRGLATCEKGMQQLIDALETDLQAKGVKIHLNADFKAEQLSLATTVLACPPPVAAKLLENQNPEQSQALQQIFMPPLITATLFYNQGQKQKIGFGCLIPRGQSLRTLGVLMNSYIFPGRDVTYNETFILGGATDPDIMTLSDEELKQRLILERKTIFGAELSILHCEITRWPQALPHYDVNLEKMLPKIKAPARVHLHGNYLGGIGLSKILDRSQQLAEEIQNS